MESDQLFFALVICMTNNCSTRNSGMQDRVYLILWKHLFCSILSGRTFCSGSNSINFLQFSVLQKHL